MIASLGSKIATALWFLKRPHLYRQAVRTVRLRIRPHPKEETRDEATRWCEERSVDSQTALERLTGDRRPEWSVKRAHVEDFRQARVAATRSVAEMGGPGDLDVLYYLAEHGKATRVIETGVAYGWSSLAILLSLRHRPEAHLISVDMPYVRRGTEDFVGCVVPETLRPHWTLIRLPDRDGLPTAITTLGPVDLCHYDSDKTYVGRLWAYPLMWDALRPGEHLISDDVQDNVAFSEFATRVEQEPVVVSREETVVVSRDKTYVGILTKPLDVTR